MTDTQQLWLTFLCLALAVVSTITVIVFFTRDHYWIGSLFVLIALASLAGLAELNHRRKG